MQRIEIKNFGPIKDVAFDIKDYTIFIGTQASGKSTITRVVFFFELLNKWAFPFVFFNEKGELVGGFQAVQIDPLLVKIKSTFLEWFEPAFLQSNGTIYFHYNRDDHVRMTFSSGIPEVHLSESLVKQPDEIKTCSLELNPRSMSRQEAVFVDSTPPSFPDAPLYLRYILAGRTIFSNVYNQLSFNVDL